MRKARRQLGTQARWVEQGTMAAVNSFHPSKPSPSLRAFVPLCLRASAFVVLLAALGCQSNGKNQAPHQTAADAKQEISALLDQYTQALIAKDAAALDRIWADDLTFINLRGEVLNKQDRMDNIKSGATAFKTIDVTEKKIRVYGETAAGATCKVAIEGQYSGQPGGGNFAVTTVWSRAKGEWQMVAVQMTRIL